MRLGKSARNLLVSTLTIAALLSGATVADSMVALSKREAREELLAYLMRNSETKKPAVVREYLSRYRVSTRASVLNLNMAPYPRFLIGGEIAKIYPAVYSSQWEALTTVPPLDLLFDGFMELIVKGKVEGEMKKAADQIGVRMAKQVLKGASPFCKIDITESPAKKYSKFKLVQLKADVMNWVKPCTYRKVIFAEAKQQLIEARRNPKTVEDFKTAAIEVFPTEFRKQFTTQLSEEVKNFSNLVIQKFDGEMHPIWGENGGVLEDIEGLSIEEGIQHASLFDIARGLRTDLAAAAVLKKSDDKKDRGLAAGLFYAVVNRLLYLTGGDQIKWDSQSRKMVILDPMAAVTRTFLNQEKTQWKDTFNGPWSVVFLDPQTPPRFEYEAFGGWGFELNHEGQAKASNWDWENYNPDARSKPTPFRLFAHQFQIDGAGLASVKPGQEMIQESRDLGELIQAVSEFMNATAPGGAFAENFGGEEQIGDLLDPEKPMLFPTKGRLLAVGVVAALAKNLMHPVLGHVEETGTGIQLAFRDRATFEAISKNAVSTEGVASLLSAAADLRESLRTDPIVEAQPDLKEVAPKLETLLQLGALGLGAASQTAEGMMTEYLFTPTTQFSLSAQITGMRAMLKAYNQTKVLLLQIRLMNAWTTLMQNIPEQISAREKLEVLKLWDDSQSYLRGQQPDAPWATWSKQLRRLSGL